MFHAFTRSCVAFIFKLIYDILYNIANHIGGNEWRLEIGDSREREARKNKA